MKLNNEDLVKLFQETNNEIYFNELFKQNQQLIGSLTSKYCSKHIDYNIDDITSLAYIGFFKAVKYYNFDKNVKFSTFVTKAMKNEIFRINVDSEKQKRKLYESISLFITPHNCEAELSEIVKYEENVFEGYDRLEDEEQFDLLVKSIKKVLKPKHFEIVEMLINGVEQKEIAIKLNVTHQNISAVVKTIRKKIRQNNIL